MTSIKLPLLALSGVLALAACNGSNGDVNSASSTATPAADQSTAGATPPADASAQAATPGAATPDQTAPGAATPGTPAPAAGANPTVGGAPMLVTKTIVENAAAAPNLTTLVKAVQAAGLAQTLSGPGPFTVFAPTNDAFNRLAPGTVDTLMKPESKASLVKVLTYHVVPGNITLAQLKQQVAAGGGTARLTTVEGEPLTVTIANNVVQLTDVNGNKSYVETADVKQSNGVVHVVNGVVVPKLG